MLVERGFWTIEHAGGSAAGQAETLLGRPVVESSDMPVVAAGALAVAFGDFTAVYRIYDRVGLTMIRDPFTKARTRLHLCRRKRKARARRAFTRTANKLVAAGLAGMWKPFAWLP